MILGGPPRHPNPLNDVARRLGMIASPFQVLYREARRAGRSKSEAHQQAIRGSLGLTALQTMVVLKFIQANAVWTIPEEAWTKERNVP